MCTGQAFTFEEWVDYLKTHPDSGHEIVFTSGEFRWNINDACLTPNVPIDCKVGPYGFTVRTAMSPCGRWSSGCHYWFSISSGISGARFITSQDDGFGSEKEAVFDELEFIEKRLLREIEDCKGRMEYDDNGDPVSTSSIIPKLKKTLEQVRKYKDIYDPVQLELFEL